MDFLKNFFNDDSKIVGLCAFETLKPNYAQKPATKTTYYNPFFAQKAYETNFSKNAFLRINY